MLRAIAILPPEHGQGSSFDVVVLQHDERRVRRKLLTLRNGDEVLIDLAQTTTLEPHSGLKLDDGRIVEILAADELLYEIRAKTKAHLIRLAWHIGNRHTSAQLEENRILIKRDHVLKNMLEGLGATINQVSEPFFAEHGAYHSHGDQSHALTAR